VSTAVETSGPILAPHQSDAVERLSRLLECRRGALLADEPGLGKTWTAAAVAAQRAASGASVEVIAPASLCSYWRDVMAMFAVKVTVISHDLLARERMQRDVRLSPRLVIVDEAHRFRNPLTKRYEGLTRISIGARLLLVTATPLCNDPVDLVSLMDLIAADDELDDSGVASIAECVTGKSVGLSIVMQQLVVRRSAVELTGLVPRATTIRIDYVPIPGMDELTARIGELAFPWMSCEVSHELMRSFLQRRLESSVAALSATLGRMARLCRRARVLAERGAALSAGDLRLVLGDPESGSFQDILFPVLWGAGGEAASPGLFEVETSRLERLRRSLPADSKVEILESIVVSREGTPGLVFTTSYDTARSLLEAMSGRRRCALLTGSRCIVRGVRRDIGAVVSALNAGEVDVIVATDVGGEGLNLEGAGYVVHYDQPWSPAVLEQRTGRIGRMGQKRRCVESIELVPSVGRSRRIIERKKDSLSDFFERWRDEAPFPRTSRGGWCLPPKVRARDVEALLVRMLRQRGVCDGELADLLGRRQRVGVERWIGRLLSGIVDRREIERLRSILRAERTMSRVDSRAI
jgi:superfamily II DNA or RNA helicase